MEFTLNMKLLNNLKRNKIMITLKGNFKNVFFENKPHSKKNESKRIVNFLKKLFTHNYCVNCGFTKKEVYVVEVLSEAGIPKCKNCINEQYLNK